MSDPPYPRRTVSGWIVINDQICFNENIVLGRSAAAAVFRGKFKEIVPSTITKCESRRSSSPDVHNLQLPGEDVMEVDDEKTDVDNMPKGKAKKRKLPKSQRKELKDVMEVDDEKTDVDNLPKGKAKKRKLPKSQRKELKAIKDPEEKNKRHAELIEQSLESSKKVKKSKPMKTGETQLTVSVKRVWDVNEELEKLNINYDNDHIIQYFHLIIQGDYIYRLFNIFYASLNEYMESIDPMHEYEQMPPMDIIRQITDGTAYMHACEIMHSKLKPHNILLFNTSENTMKAVVSDVDICRASHAPSKRVAWTTGYDGWSSPEAINRGKLSFSTDVFSLACIYYYILTKGSHPFGDSNDRIGNILKKKCIVGGRRDTLPQEYRELFLRALSHSTVDRPTVFEILADPTFQNPANVLSAEQISDQYKAAVRLAEDRPPREVVPIGRIKVSKELEYDLNDVISTGSNGTKVFRGEYGHVAGQRQNVAVKRVFQDFHLIVDNEVNFLKMCDRRCHVVSYFNVVRKNQFYYLIIELCKGSLEDFLRRRENMDGIPKISEEDILLQTTEGLKHLHSLEILHRNLTPRHILISTTGAKSTVLLSDLSLSSSIESSKNSNTAINKTPVGTNGWMAPEAFEGLVTMKSDIFSLGIVFYYVLTNCEHPYGRVDQQNNINTGTYKVNPRSLSCEESHMIRRILSHSSKSRPSSVDAILKHPCFWNSERRQKFFCRVSDTLKPMGNLYEIAKTERIRSLNKEEAMHKKILQALEQKYVADAWSSNIDQRLWRETCLRPNSLL